MGAITATIFIGSAHPNHGGINPTHYILLSENSRPCLQLKDINGNEIINIIPTIENMVDDVYFMIFSFILKQKDSNVNEISGKEMYEVFNKDKREQLYEEIKNGLQGINIKVVFNIFDESALLNQINKIKEYPNDCEITTSIYRKEYSQWTGKTVIKEN